MQRRPVEEREADGGAHSSLQAGESDVNAPKTVFLDSIEFAVFEAFLGINDVLEHF